MNPSLSQPKPNQRPQQARCMHFPCVCAVLSVVHQCTDSQDNDTSVELVPANFFDDPQEDGQIA
jgi:hypothetical protein